MLYDTCFPKNEDCPSDSPFLQTDNIYKCQKSCGIEDMQNDKCILDNSSTESLNTIYQMFKDLISSQYNNEELILKNPDNSIFQLTNSLNEKNKLINEINNYYNLSIIDLGKCEELLKRENKIPDNIDLIIFKYESYYNNSKNKYVQYEIYNPINRSKILDLSVCKDYNIDIYIPIKDLNISMDNYEDAKNQGYDILNPKDKFYNDVCTKYTSIYSTDLIVNDRRDIIYNKNNKICQDNCEYKNINLKTNLAKCECPTDKNCQIEFNLVDYKISFNKVKLLNNFKDISSISNIMIIKCYKYLFAKEGLLYNIGSYILLISIFLYIILLIAFYLKGYSYIIGLLKEIISTKDETQEKNINNLSRSGKNKLKNKVNNKILGINKLKKNSKIKRKKRNSKKNNTCKSFSHTKLNNEITNISSPNKKKKIKNKLNIKNNKNTSNEKLFITDYELNIFTYEEAKRYDKRNYGQYYFSLLRIKHLLIFTFHPNKDYNSKIIKICLFIFYFNLLFSLNGLFFTDKVFHKIYDDEGEFNFVYQLPQFIYTAIISNLIYYLIKFLSLSDKTIIELKQKKRKDIKKMEEKVIESLKIKFILFFVLSFIFLIIFWYYLGCFCSIYINSQLFLIKDTLISFGTSLLYPIFTNLFPGIFRIYALKSDNKICIYKISTFIQWF